MKLATLKDGSRDGQLVVVSHDLAQAHFASGIAGRLQQVLDDWNYLSPQLQDLYQTLNHGKARHAFAFDPAACLAPLPRAYHWAMVGPAATPDHDAPGPIRHDAGDAFLGPADDVPCGGGAATLLCDAAWVAITGDLPVGATTGQALEGIRLLGLAALWRPDGEPVPAGPMRPAFAPVVTTPDALGPDWLDGRLRLSVAAAVNGRPAAAGATTTAAGFGPALVRLSEGRRLRAGAMVALVAGPTTPAASALGPGDHLRLEAVAAAGERPFGAIAQVVAPAPGASGPRGVAG